MRNCSGNFLSEIDMGSVRSGSSGIGRRESEVSIEIVIRNGGNGGIIHRVLGFSSVNIQTSSFADGFIETLQVIGELAD